MLFISLISCLFVFRSSLGVYCVFFFFKQKTAYEMRISDWSSDVCSSDLSENTAQKVALNYLKQKAISQTLKNQLAEIVKKNKEIGRASCRERVCKYV